MKRLARRNMVSSSNPQDRRMLDEEISLWLNTSLERVHSMVERRCFPAVINTDGNYIALQSDVLAYINECEKVPSDFDNTPLPDPYRVTEWLIGGDGELHWAPSDGATEALIRWIDMVDNGPRHANVICEKSGNYDAPILVDRFYAVRCELCCEEVGIPSGRGSWRNDPISRTDLFIED